MNNLVANVSNGDRIKKPIHWSKAKHNPEHVIFNDNILLIIMTSTQRTKSCLFWTSIELLLAMIYYGSRGHSWCLDCLWSYLQFPQIHTSIWNFDATYMLMHKEKTVINRQRSWNMKQPSWNFLNLKKQSPMIWNKLVGSILLNWSKSPIFPELFMYASNHSSTYWLCKFLLSIVSAKVVLTYNWLISCFYWAVPTF